MLIQVSKNIDQWHSIDQVNGFKQVRIHGNCQSFENVRNILQFQEIEYKTILFKKWSY